MRLLKNIKNTVKVWLNPHKKKLKVSAQYPFCEASLIELDLAVFGAETAQKLQKKCFPRPRYIGQTCDLTKAEPVGIIKHIVSNHWATRMCL